MSLAVSKPLISEQEYQEVLRETFGEEMAALCNLPFEQRIRAIAEYQFNFETPRDRIWPAEGYDEPDLP